MHFLHPWFLVGLAAVAAPVVIHLVFRVKARVLLFPSVRFLKQAEKRVARWQKLSELLVLALRCLLLALLATALAAPVTAGGTAQSGTAAVIVLDDSLSMGLRDAEGTLFQRGKGLARTILSTLGPGDQACVLTSRRRAELGRDVDALRRELDAVEPTAAAGTLREPIEQALELLAKTEAARKELWVVSDVQRRACDLAGLEPEKRGVTAIVVPVASPRRDNFTLGALEQVSTVAAVGAPFRVRAVVLNRGPEAASRSLKVLVDDRTAGEQLVSCAPGGRATATVDLTLDTPGVHVVTASLQDDALPGDDVRRLVVQARARPRVVVVRHDASRSLHLERALNPGGRAETGAQVHACEPRELPDLDPRDTAAVFLQDALPEDERGLATLRAYVEQGGGVVVATSGPLDGLGALAPARQEGVLGDRARPETWLAIREVDATHAAFAWLRRGTPARLDAATFTRAAKLVPADEARVLARFGSGDPAIVERAHGRGRVLVIASPLSPDATTLPHKVTFLPLVQSLVATLAASGPGEQVRAGEALRLVLGAEGAPESARLLRPGVAAEDAKARVARNVATYDFGRALVPGPATFEWLSQERVESRTLSVEVDPDEGVLEYQDPARALAGARVAKTGEEVLGLVGAIRQGRSFKLALLVMALTALLAEGALANRLAFGKGREAPRADVVGTVVAG